jgi:ribose 5-phosphate isomerase B
MKIIIASDHAGYEMKHWLIHHFSSFIDVQWMDLGPFNGESIDYPDYAHPLAEKVLQGGEGQLGILLCGSGNGVCMSANKHQGIRAALAWNEEISRLARQHNDANVLCIPARFVDKDEVEKIVQVFISTSFEGGRHQNRVDKIKIK